MTILMKSSLWQRPGTRLGWWAVGLGAAFLTLFLINSAVFMPICGYGETPWWCQSLLPFYGIFTMLCGFSAGVIGLVAVICQRERSWLVWLTILPGAFVVIFLLGEFLVPH
jgi:hypothetical protein